MVVREQSSVMTFLNHDKCDRRLIIWLQRRTCLILNMQGGQGKRFDSFYHPISTIWYANKWKARLERTRVLPYEWHQVHKAELDKIDLRWHHPCKKCSLSGIANTNIVRVCKILSRIAYETCKIWCAAASAQLLYGRRWGVPWIKQKRNKMTHPRSYFANLQWVI